MVVELGVRGVQLLANFLALQRSGRREEGDFRHDRWQLNDAAGALELGVRFDEAVELILHQRNV